MSRAEKASATLKAFLSTTLAGSLSQKSVHAEEASPAAKGAVTCEAREQEHPRRFTETPHHQVQQHSTEKEQPRRFTETPVRRKRSRWHSKPEDDESPTQPRSDSPPTANTEDPIADAVKRAREAVSHLGEYNRDEKDTYEDAIESGGTIEGGTWEHRKRGKEMVNTSEISQIVNELHKRRRGGGGAIPPEALKALLESSGSRASVSDPATSGPKLDSSNRGFQLLQKSGWKLGEGLGLRGDGLKEPIEAKETNVIEEKPTNDGEVDEFAEYRRRMMLAYRFRPNPLNNPRRSYDNYSTIYDSGNVESVIGEIASENLLNK